MDFGEKLKDIRKKEGMSQEQLAEKIGVSRQAITKWETGRGLPDVENMVILAEIFKMTLDELVLQEKKLQEKKAAERRLLLLKSRRHLPAKTEKLSLAENATAVKKFSADILPTLFSCVKSPKKRNLP